MAFILKDDKVYSDTYGYMHGDFYAVIDEVFVDKAIKLGNFNLRIYKDRDCRVKKLQPSNIIAFDINNDLFDKFFELVYNSRCIYNAAYIWAEKTTDLSDWRSDEVSDTTGVITKDS